MARALWLHALVDEALLARAICALSAVIVSACVVVDQRAAIARDADPGAGCLETCSRYADCFDEDFAIEACAARCEDELLFEEAAACRACMDDAACLVGEYDCAADCDALFK